MAPFPLPLDIMFGKIGAYLVYLVIGFGFGYVLEISGFGSSPKLAAQFYFRELTVLKVMFSAIVVAMVLIFAATGLGLLDFNLLWVNPTYLWPGIVGGLIMGVGFIIGGFCPGTSLVAVATFKKDGLFFTLGVLFGIFAFGETVSFFENFWNSSYMGRFTIPEWLNLPTGVVVVILILMALFMFWGSEQLERIIGKKDIKKEPRWRYAAAGALFTGAMAVMFIGQPNIMDRWNALASTKQPLLDQRAVQIHPGELLATLADRGLQVIMLDVRSEADYNLFHIEDARLTPPDSLDEMIPGLLAEPPNTVVVVMSNDETTATDAWKHLIAQSVPNVYILEGGINHWLDYFAEEDEQIRPLVGSAEETLRYDFPAALGARYPAATPNPHDYELEYVPKIKLELKRGGKSGGCG
jgi:rhodanese-related sulfurtransferase